MDRSERRPGSLLLAAGVEAAIVVVALAAGAIVGTPALATMRVDVPAALAGVAATVPLLALFLVFLRWPLGPLRRMREILDEHVVPLFRGASLLDLLAIACLAGLGEEMLFRGVIQAAVGSAAGPRIGLVVASAAFGLAHLVTPTYAVVAALVGAWLGWVWLETGSLLAPVVAHALYDFVALVVLVRRPART